jgi:hypothetical protein
MAGPVRVLLLAFSLGLPPTGAAHDLFADYIQHSAQLVVGARHVDLTLELTFFEEWSARERQAMDRDGNGRLTSAERAVYLQRLEMQLADQVTLLVAGRKVPLVGLYEPELDWMGNAETGSGHHRLRLFFFVPTPTGLRAKDEIVVEDRLWPDAKFLGTTWAEGRDGCKLSTDMLPKPGFTPATVDARRNFIFRCLRPPSATPLTTTQTAP